MFGSLETREEEGILKRKHSEISSSLSNPISSHDPREQHVEETSGKIKGRRKCWKIKMKRRKVKLLKRPRKSERTLNSCMRHGDDHGME